MKEEQIIEGNKLILEFLGFTVKDFDGAGVRYIEKENDFSEYYNWSMLKDVEYHENWTDLMTVVEKIETLNMPSWEITSFSFAMYPKQCSVRCHFDNRQDGAIYSTDWQADFNRITAVYDAVIGFIKWYQIESNR